MDPIEYAGDAASADTTAERALMRGYHYHVSAFGVILTILLGECLFYTHVIRQTLIIPLVDRGSRLLLPLPPPTLRSSLSTSTRHRSTRALSTSTDVYIRRSSGGRDDEWEL